MTQIIDRYSFDDLPHMAGLILAHIKELQCELAGLVEEVEKIKVPERYNRTEAARYLGISNTTFGRRLQEGAITPHCDDGGRSYYLKSELDEMIKGGKVGGEAT